MSIIVAGPKEPIKYAKEIWLKITFTKISGRDISFLKSPGDGDLPLRGRIEVHDERGKDVSLVRAGETAEIPEMGSKVLHTLKPGDAFTYEVDVAKSHDMSKPGTYTVQFHHFIGNEEVLSNPLVLSVAN